MAEQPYKRFNIQRAQTVTLNDGDEVRFRWLEFDHLRIWHELAESENPDRQYLETLLSALSYYPDDTLDRVADWEDSKIIELTEKYIAKFGEIKAELAFKSLLRARERIDKFLGKREQELTEVAQKGMANLNKWLDRAAILPDMKTSPLVGDSFLNLYESLTKSPILELAGIYQSQFLHLEQISRTIANPVLPFTTISDQIADSMRNMLTWTESVRTSYENLFPIFGEYLLDSFPTEIEEFLDENRGDILLELKLHFLLDAANTWIEAFVERLTDTASERRPAEITKYLHRLTSTDDFISKLVTNIALSPKISGRRRAVEAALNAHARRDYLLSIPALLPQVEALTMHLLNREGYVKWSRAKESWYETDPKTGKYRMGGKEQKTRIKVGGLGSLDGIVKRISNSPLPN